MQFYRLLKMAAATVAVACAVVVSAPGQNEAMAAPDPVVASVTVGANGTSTTSGFLDVGNYLFKLSVFDYSNIAYRYVVSLLDVGGKVTSLYDSTLPPAGSAGAATYQSAFTVSSGPVKYFLALTSYSIQNSPSAPTGGAIATISTVPGPIAGAGLPVLLGMIGYAFYRRRLGQVAA